MKICIGLWNSLVASKSNMEEGLPTSCLRHHKERLWGRQRTSAPKEHLPFVLWIVCWRKVKASERGKARREEKRKDVLSMLSITTKWENESNGVAWEWGNRRNPPSIVEMSVGFPETREERMPTSPQADLVPTPQFLRFGARRRCISPLRVMRKHPYKGNGVVPVRPMPKMRSIVQGDLWVRYEDREYRTKWAEWVRKQLSRSVCEQLRSGRVQRSS